jgi:hypothetical protein
MILAHQAYPGKDQLVDYLEAPTNSNPVVKLAQLLDIQLFAIFLISLQCFGQD